MRAVWRVIFISGYAEESFRNSPDRPEDCLFLPKPFSLKQLTSKVKAFTVTMDDFAMEFLNIAERNFT